MNEQRWLKLGAFGWVANIATVVWTAFSGIMWLFPLEKNPSALSMSEFLPRSLPETLLMSRLAIDYACAVIGILALICGADWFFYARRRFNGPTEDALIQKLEKEHLMATVEVKA